MTHSGSFPAVLNLTDLARTRFQAIRNDGAVTSHEQFAKSLCHPRVTLVSPRISKGVGRMSLMSPLSVVSADFSTSALKFPGLLPASAVFYTPSLHTSPDHGDATAPGLTVSLLGHGCGAAQAGNGRAQTSRIGTVQSLKLRRAPSRSCQPS